MDFSFFLPYELLPWHWVVWVLMGLSIGLTKAGFAGTTAVVIPFIAIIFGARESTGLLLPLLSVADIFAVVYYRRNAEWKYILRLLPPALAGFGIALFVDHLVPVQAFRYLMGGCILAGLVVMVVNDRREKDKPPPSGLWFSAIFGIAAGFSTMVGNVSGAIMAVFLLSMRLPKTSFAGTSAWYFLIINALKYPIQFFLWKNITVESLGFGVTLVPVVLLGLALGILLIRKIPEAVFRKTIMVLTLVSTVLLFI